MMRINYLHGGGHDQFVLNRFTEMEYNARFRNIGNFNNNQANLNSINNNNNNNSSNPNPNQGNLLFVNAYFSNCLFIYVFPLFYTKLTVSYLFLY